jgi:hypothetical protein
MACVFRTFPYCPVLSRSVHSLGLFHEKIFFARRSCTRSPAARHSPPTRLGRELASYRPSDVGSPDGACWVADGGQGPK